MKKILSLFVVLALLCSIVGCTNNVELLPVGEVEIPGEMEFKIGKYTPKERYRTHYKNSDGKLKERYVSLISYNYNNEPIEYYIYEDEEKFDKTATYKILDSNRNITNGQSSDDIAKWGYSLYLFEIVDFEDSTTMKSGDDIIRRYSSYCIYMYTAEAANFYGTKKKGSEIAAFVKSIGGEMGKGNERWYNSGWSTKDDLLGDNFWVCHQYCCERFYKGITMPEGIETEYIEINGVDELTYKNVQDLNGTTTYKWLNRNGEVAEDKDGTYYMYFLYEGTNKYPIGVIYSATKIKEYGVESTIDDFDSYEKTDDWWYGWWESIDVRGLYVWVCHRVYIWQRKPN